MDPDSRTVDFVLEQSLGNVPLLGQLWLSKRINTHLENLIRQMRRMT